MKISNQRIVSNIKFVAFAILASTFAMSCSNEETEEVGNSKVAMQFTAVREDVETSEAAAKATRTTLHDGSMMIDWLENDAIAVFSENKSSNPDKFTAKAGGRTAVFTGTTTESNTYRALYPYDEKATYDGSAFHTTLPDDQIVDASGMASNACLMVATLANAHPSMANNSLVFKNACGILKVTFKYESGFIKDVKDKVSAINVVARDKKSISGKVKIGADGNCVIDNAESKDIYAHTENDQDLAEGVSYYIMMPAQRVNGIIVKLSNSNGKTSSFTVKSPIDFTRNKVQQLNLTVKKWDEKK